MRQFDVYRNPSARSESRIPFLVALQSHLLAASHLTVVAPMLPQDDRSALTEISATVSFKGAEYIVLVVEMAAVETRLLRAPLGDLSNYEDDIRRALDRLFTGF